MTWIEEADVLAWLGLDQSGPVLSAAIATAEGLVPTWRLADRPVDWSVVKASHPHVYNAAVQYAALVYQENVTPEGFAGFDEAGGLVLPSNAKIVSIRHQARANAPAVG